MRELWPDFSAQRVVYEDADLIVVDKPAGVPAQAAEVEHDDDLVARLKRFLAARDGGTPEQVYLGVHQRLDRDTSGLVLFTKSKAANPAIAAQFEGRSLDKTYVAAVTYGAAIEKQRVLEHHLARAADGRTQVVRPGASGAQLARTRVRVRERLAERALLELGLETGRTHQLRVQLAHEGVPIAGDGLYGGEPALRLLLHAAELRLKHPRTGAELRLHADLPPEIERWLRDGPLDAGLAADSLQRALELAIERRYRLARTRSGNQPTTAFRLLHQAADGVAEVAIDLYGEHAVAHFFAADDALEQRVLTALEAFDFAGVYCKRHRKQKNELVDARASELAPAAPVRGAAAADPLIILEHGIPYEVRLGDGLRTGLFLDQRANRKRVHDGVRDKRVLNLFAYTGGFSVAALAGGAAEAVSVDVSGAALQWADRNAARIGAEARHRSYRDDAFALLARLARRGEQFDWVILDPPSYATAGKRRFVARRDYAELCQACARVLAPGGVLLACINHHEATQAWLRREARSGVMAAGRVATSLRDLPTPLDFPAQQGQEPLSKAVIVTCG